MSNVLVTGCNGLIGSALIEELKCNSQICLFGLSRSVEVDGVKNIFTIDLENDWDISSLPPKMDVVIHLAQSEKFRDFPGSSQQVFNVNTQSTLKLLEYSRISGVKKFIYASSGGVYGNSDSGFSEESPLQPNKDLGFYLSTKFCSELLVSNYQALFEVNILRFFFVFGEKQKQQMLIPRLFQSVRSGMPISLQGTEGIKLNPIYVTDAAMAICKVMNQKGSFNLNIAGTEIISIKELTELMGRLCGKTPIYNHQQTEVKNLIGDISKLKKIFTPKYTLEEALKKCIPKG